MDHFISTFRARIAKNQPNNGIFHTQNQSKSRKYWIRIRIVTDPDPKQTKNWPLLL